MIFNKSRGKVPERNTVLLFIRQNYQLKSIGEKNDLSNQRKIKLSLSKEAQTMR